MKSLNNKITLLTIFDSIITEGLSPNQYYLLQCLNENITAPSVNLHQDLRHLVSNEWIKDETSAKGPLYILQPKAKSLIIDHSRQLRISFSTKTLFIASFSVKLPLAFKADSSKGEVLNALSFCCLI